MAKKSNLERFEDAYNESLGETAQFLEEAYTDYQFFVGNQWTQQEKTYLKKFNRETVVFNYTRRFIKRVGGHQRKNRLATVIQPRENQDEYIAELYDDVSKWVHQRGKIYQRISEAFEKGALVPGWNLLHIYMDYSADPINGMPKVARRGYNTFLLAPDFKELDLSDCRYIITRDYMSKDDAKRLLPKKARAIEDLKGGQKDNKFEFSGTQHLKNEDIVSYTEFWERISEKRYMLMNNLSGKSEKWVGTKKDLDEHVEKFPWITYIAYFEPTVQQTVFIQGEEMYHGIDPYGSIEKKIGFNDYPFVLVSGYFEPEMDLFEWKCQGVVRTLRDAQREENKRRSQMFTILDSSPYGGYIVKNGSVINNDDLYQSGPGVVITLDEAAQMGDLQELRSREVPQSTMLLSQQLKQDMVELGGGSEEFMGTADLGNTQVSGTLAKIRASQSVESLQDLLDNLNHAQESLGSKLIKLYRINFTKEFVERITGKEVPDSFFTEEVEKYDILAAEGMLTDTNRNLAYVQALQARQAGVNIPDRFIQEIIPIANKSRLNEIYEEEAQQAQEAQQKVLEQEEIAKRLANAETISRLSLADERKARAKADVGLLIERTSEASQNNSLAVLNQVRAMSELSEMEQNRVLGAYQFILDLQDREEEKDFMRQEMSVAKSEGI